MASSNHRRSIECGPTDILVRSVTCQHSVYTTAMREKPTFCTAERISSYKNSQFPGVTVAAGKQNKNWNYKNLIDIN
jgi:hypothetical protein